MHTLGTFASPLTHGHFRKRREGEARMIVDTGINPFTRSAAFRDVVWSVAVQHGPGATVITQALADDAVLINAIYDERGTERVGRDGKKTLKYFSKSTLDVQAGVRKRMLQERHCALHMLNVEKQHWGTKTR